MSDLDLTDEQRAEIAEEQVALQTLSMKDLRRLWRQNRRESRDAIRTLDFALHRHLIAYLSHCLIPEFERRGYRCADPERGNLILEEPQKRG